MSNSSRLNKECPKSPHTSQVFHSRSDVWKLLYHTFQEVDVEIDAMSVFMEAGAFLVKNEKKKMLLYYIEHFTKSQSHVMAHVSKKSTDEMEEILKKSCLPFLFHHVDSFPMILFLKKAGIGMNGFDEFGRTPLIAAIRKKEKRRAFMLLAGGCEIRLEKYLGFSKETLIEVCIATSQLYEIYMEEIEKTPNQDIVRVIIWEFLFFWKKPEVIAVKNNIDAFIEEQKSDAFWDL